jgi:hypothetical protein
MRAIITAAAIIVGAVLGRPCSAEQPPPECFQNSPPSVAFLYEAAGGLEMWREGRYPASSADRACLIVSSCPWPVTELGYGLNGLLATCKQSRPTSRESGATTTINYCEGSPALRNGLSLITSLRNEMSPEANCGAHSEFSDSRAARIFVGNLSTSRTCFIAFIRLSDLAQGLMVTTTPCPNLQAVDLQQSASMLFQSSKLWLAARSWDGAIGVSLYLTQRDSTLQIDETDSRVWGPSLDGSTQKIRSWLVAVAKAANSAATLPTSADDPLPNAQVTAPVPRALRFLLAGMTSLSSKPFSNAWYSDSAMSARRWMAAAELAGLGDVLLRTELLSKGDKK